MQPEVAQNTPKIAKIEDTVKNWVAEIIEMMAVTREAQEAQRETEAKQRENEAKILVLLADLRQSEARLTESVVATPCHSSPHPKASCENHDSSFVKAEEEDKDWESDLFQEFYSFYRRELFH
jgi:hypothetical protein